MRYYGHRYYNANLGRFINKDPIAEAGGINLYGFVRNDAINLYDVHGESFTVTQNGNNVVINVPIIFSGGSTAQQNKFIKNVDSTWSGLQIDGLTVSVQVTILTTIPTDGSIYNTVIINTNPKTGASQSSGRSFVQGAKTTDSNRQYASSSNTTIYYYTSGGSKYSAAHEIGHVLGLPDQYTDYYVTPWGGQIPATKENAGKYPPTWLQSVPNSTASGQDLMGDSDKKNISAGDLSTILTAYNSATNGAIKFPSPNSAPSASGGSQPTPPSINPSFPDPQDSNNDSLIENDSSDPSDGEAPAPTGSPDPAPAQDTAPPPSDGNFYFIVPTAPSPQDGPL